MRRVVVLTMLAAVVTLASAAVPASTLGSQDNLGQAIAAQQRHTPALLAQSGVVGTAVGETEDGRAAVLILTERAVPGLPQVLDSVPVRVRVTGRLVALHHRPGHGSGTGGGGGGTGDPNCSTTNQTTVRCQRPVPIGVSTGHPLITAGTIGARVKRGDTTYALSNNHVYAAMNDATLGSNVLQPGRYDGGTDPADAIGTLAQFVPIVFGGAANYVDAAIAASSTANLGNATPSDGYGTPKSAPVTAMLNQRVQKYGRTTKQTRGFISGVNATVDVSYGDKGVARFHEQIIIQPGNFSDGGDSGSLVVAQGGANDRRPVGLLFAGSPVVTIANPIGRVLSELGVAIDGQ